jgi:hypothetical protein
VSGVNSVKGPGGLFSVTVSLCYCVAVLLGVIASLGVQRCLESTPCHCVTVLLGVTASLYH